MSRLLTKRTLLAVLVIVASFVFVHEIRPRPVPGKAQDKLTDIQQVDLLREQFNHDAGQVRFILLVSPT